VELDFLEALQSHFTSIAAGLSILKTVKIAKIVVDFVLSLSLVFGSSYNSCLIFCLCLASWGGSTEPLISIVVTVRLHNWTLERLSLSYLSLHNMLAMKSCNLAFQKRKGKKLEHLNVQFFANCNLYYLQLEIPLLSCSATMHHAGDNVDKCPECMNPYCTSKCTRWKLIKPENWISVKPWKGLLRTC